MLRVVKKIAKSLNIVYGHWKLHRCKVIYTDAGVRSYYFRCMTMCLLSIYLVPLKNVKISVLI